MSWNRKYRPQKISELHLAAVRDNLQSLIENKNIPQAFLFAGPKGTGKTSSSRIIGAILNEEKNAKIVKQLFEEKTKGTSVKGSIADPDTSNPFIQKILSGNSFVVQEMDAASNRGIDNIRELKERIALPPQEGNMTVYILDEAHMLTTEAFNALLKVLEEPPSHVVFILATTELHKVPETITSRCHLVTFTKASITEISAALEKIIQAEKITADTEAVTLIAQYADGSFRDAIKLLEVLTENGKLTHEHVSTKLASTSAAQYEQLVTAITSKREEAVISLFQTLRAQGSNEKYFHTQFLEMLHKTLLGLHGIGTPLFDISEPATLFLLKEFASSSLSEQSPIPFLHLELTALEIITRAKQKKTSKKPKAQAELMGQVPTISMPLPTDSTADPKTPTKKEIKSMQTIEKEISSPEPVTVTVDTTAPRGNAEKLVSEWDSFVDEVSKDNTTIGALLRSARPLGADGHTVTIGVYYSFHQEQLSENKFLVKIQDTVTEFSGGVVNFVFELVNPPQVAELTDPGTNQTEAKDLAQLASESLM